MIKTAILSATLAAAVLFPAQAQVVSWSENSPRMLTRIGLWNQASQRIEGQFSIQYGTPIWKDEYDGLRDKARGKSLRLGKDFWTTLDNDIPLRIGGVDVPIGQHYLGLTCDKEGQFQLMIMNGATVKKYKSDGWSTEKLTAKINAPLSYAKVATKQKKLSICLVQHKKDATRAKLVIHWGNHQLSAVVEITLAPKAVDASAKKSGRIKMASSQNRSCSSPNPQSRPSALRTVS